MDDFDLYLASKSPRRRELLSQIGVRYKVVSVNVPEEPGDSEPPQAYVERLAVDKAHAGVTQTSGLPVLGSDTIVVHRGRILEKPENREQGISMLLDLSESTHSVLTSVCVSDGNRSHVKVNATSVGFRKIDEREATSYWNTGEPADKAGGYGIQGLGSIFVSTISGSYSAVVGLPLTETAELLTEFSVPIWQ